MTIVTQPINKRPYMIMYHDCFDNDIFDNQSQRTVYMTLKKFADANNQCFPGLKKIASVALLSKRAVQKALKELKDKLLVTIEKRFRKDGSQTSNLYTIHDVTEVQIAGNNKNAKNVENANDIKNTENAGDVKNAKNETETVQTIIEQCEDEQLVSVLKARGYTISKDDDVVAIPQDKCALNSTSETVSDNTIIAQAQDELAEENQVTEMEETAEVIPEDVVVQENESVFNNTMPEKKDSTIGKKLMSKLKNITRKEKTPTSAPTKVTDVSNNVINVNSFCNKNNTTQNTESQPLPLEKYPLDWIKQRFDYDILLHNNPYNKDDIDCVMDILYTNLNTTKKTIRINGEDKPANVVIGKLMKLQYWDIEYAIEKFREQIGRIRSPLSYLLTILYHAPEQNHLDVQNLVNYNMYGMGREEQPKPHDNFDQNRSKNQFHQFHQRDVTQAELDELEQKLLHKDLHEE